MTTAAEPKQALLLMEKERPDLVITDLMMTTLDSGFLFARAIKEDARYAGIPVIIATSVSSALGLDFRPRTDEDRANMYVDAYFDKPLDRARLLATIAELLAARAAARGDARRRRACGAGHRPGGGPRRVRRYPPGVLMPTWDNPLITIVTDKCRMCYACVRECPAKAIQVQDGQAQVIQPRCIGCGNCLRVCTQNAKQVRDDSERMFNILQAGTTKVAALVAPSFPAEFVDMAPGTLVAMIRSLGFTSVHEISLGADLVAHAYKKLLEDNPEARYITTPCPAVVSYVRKYHPHLIPNLAPLVSPMVAMARVLRSQMGEDLQVVFIGPCVAKKRASVDFIHHEFEAVLTFAELRDVFAARHMQPADFPSDDKFDPPYGGLGMIFPIAGGLLQAADLTQDHVSGELVIAEGKDEFVNAINEFEDVSTNIRLLDVLACQGCYAGAGVTSDLSLLQRRARVSAYARDRFAGYSEGESAEVEGAKHTYRDIDLSREHQVDEQTLGSEPTPEELDEILHRMGKFRAEDLLNCGACGYEGCLEHARAVHAGLADSDMCLPHTIEQLREAYGELEVSHRSLEDAKEALERSGKLASMGQLAAGIAHEVNNPLGTLLLARQPAARGVRSGLSRQRRPRDHRRPGQSLQAHNLGPAELLAPEPGAAPTHRCGRAGRPHPAHHPVRRQHQGAGRQQAGRPSGRRRPRPDGAGAD